MAKMKVFVPFDAKLGVFMDPIVVQHSGQMERLWRDIVNDGRSMPSKHPKDFVLFQTGEFDSDSGKLTSFTDLVHFMSGDEVKDRGENPLPLASGRK